MTAVSNGVTTAVLVCLSRGSTNSPTAWTPIRLHLLVLAAGTAAVVTAAAALLL